jgi:TetR/AcrR family transcriptional repressor of nem operon
MQRAVLGSERCVHPTSAAGLIVTQAFPGGRRYCSQRHLDEPWSARSGLSCLTYNGAPRRNQLPTNWFIIARMAQHTSLPAPRGRPREFDAEVAVERAMDEFWSRGYYATSLPDLLRATKLSRGSLYAAFGDKRTLFLRALDRYISNALARLDTELDPRGPGIAGIRSCLAGYVERCSGTKGRRGCLLVATAMELAGQDTDVEQRIRRFFKAMETRLAAAFTRAQAAEELAKGVEPATAARVLVCMAEGLRVVGKAAPERVVTQATIDALMDRFTR